MQASEYEPPKGYKYRYKTTIADILLYSYENNSQTEQVSASE